MYSITICIPTYKRPLFLNKLLCSINESKINRSLIKEINIIIVDNDIEKTAEITVNEIKEKLNVYFTIEYHDYPVKGLSNVRNELLRKALGLNPEFIVFIDDDEYPSAEWLNELVKTIVNNNGDMAMGPVISVFDNNVSRYISCWFERPFHLANAKINYVRTGNLIIRANSLLKFRIWFDNRFNATGSEDSYFGIQMMKKYATIYWSSGAIVFETIPGTRANLKYLIKRHFRGASNFTCIMRLEKKYLVLLKKIMVSLIYTISGICAIVILPLPIRKKYWGILKISEGMGGFAGLFNILYMEYK